MKQFRIKDNVNPNVLYNFGFKYKGNWARGELYQKEIPELKGLGDGISWFGTSYGKWCLATCLNFLNGLFKFAPSLWWLNA